MRHESLHFMFKPCLAFLSPHLHHVLVPRLAAIRAGPQPQAQYFAHAAQEQQGEATASWAALRRQRGISAARRVTCRPLPPPPHMYSASLSVSVSRSPTKHSRPGPMLDTTCPSTCTNRHPSVLLLTVKLAPLPPFASNSSHAVASHTVAAAASSSGRRRRRRKPSCGGRRRRAHIMKPIV